MTNPGPESHRRPSALALAPALLAALLVPGCGKKKAPPPPPPPPPVQRVAAPEPVKVETLATDKRVQFPQAFAPTDEALARAVAGFASAIAKGDDAAFSKMLDAPARNVLAMQTASGEWKAATATIQAVRVVRLEPHGDSADLGLAVQDPTSGGAYLTGWRAMSAGGQWLFTGLPIVAKSAPNAADLDNADLAPPVVKTPEPEKKPETPKPPPEAQEPAPPPGGAKAPKLKL